MDKKSATPTARAHPARVAEGRREVFVDRPRAFLVATRRPSGFGWEFDFEPLGWVAYTLLRRRVVATSVERTTAQPSAVQTVGTR
jgi:hypothetical protein